jgi:hypothetical protein
MGACSYKHVAPTERKMAFEFASRIKDACAPRVSAHTSQFIGTWIQSLSRRFCPVIAPNRTALATHLKINKQTHEFLQLE